jgi:hypothetical protein
MSDTQSTLESFTTPALQSASTAELISVIANAAASAAATNSNPVSTRISTSRV